MTTTKPALARAVAYADGGCDPNPGPGGWGVVIEGPEGKIELCGGDRATTNNRMELTAAIKALSHFPAGSAIEMRCDSQYVIKSVTEWMRGWKAKGWRTSTGPVKNVELMQELDALNAARDVKMDLGAGAIPAMSATSAPTGWRRRAGGRPSVSLRPANRFRPPPSRRWCLLRAWRRKRRPLPPARRRWRSISASASTCRERPNSAG